MVGSCVLPCFCGSPLLATFTSLSTFLHSHTLPPTMKRYFLLSIALLQLYTASVCAQTGDVFQPKDVRIVNPGASLNHAGLDYAPAISADGKTLFFVSNRPGSKLSKSGTPSHDFWAAFKQERLDTTFLPPFNIDTLVLKNNNGLNTSFNEGVPAISANRRVMYFTGCDRPDVLKKKVKVDGYDKEYECDIYVVELKENGEWGIPRNLGTAVNSDDWDGQPSLSPSGDRLYFASTRPGGSGDADIWYCDYDAQRRTWLPAKNAGKTVNTSGRDWSPFIAANNRELFFASDGHSPNYGGTDFYISVRDFKNGKEIWTKPRNLGKPINTDANEAFISTPAQRDVLYFSSQRKDISGFQGDYDVFMAFVPKSALTIAVPLTGTVFDGCTGQPTSATIIAYNPLTKRMFRDTLDTRKHTTFEAIINDFDFVTTVGGVEKLVDTLKIQIFAENKQLGRLFQEIIIKRPVILPNGKLESIEIPPIMLQYGSKPMFSTKLEPPPAAFIPRGAMAKVLSSGFGGLVLEEIVSVSVNRILNYVFFDEGSSTIPARYTTFNNAKEAENFDEERLRGETIDKYYHTLNVFGFRLKQSPKSSITIVGCNDNVSAKEKTLALSKARAQTVFNYLKTVWGVSEKRMKIVARDLPSVPSNREDSLGIIENRRVEILCDDWDITKPTVDRTPIISPSSPALMLELAASAQLSTPNTTAIPTATQAKSVPTVPVQTSQYKRRVIILQGNKIWRTFDASTTGTLGGIAWDWKNDKGEYPSGDQPLDICVSIVDQVGRNCLSQTVSIPVKRITADEKKRSVNNNVTADKTLERYNLIMFPFDKSDVGTLNARILREYVLPRMTQNSEVTIVGHTDVIGETQYNQTLSQSRGGNAKEELGRLSKGKYRLLESKGVGEMEPLFDNMLPEGRLYNRTVQVIIETPLGDVER